MRIYVNPECNMITVENADILTVSSGDGVFRMDFGSFTESVSKGGTGSAGSADWNNDFT